MVLKMTANKSASLPGRRRVRLEQEARSFYSSEAEDKAICGKICFLPSQGSTAHRSHGFAIFGDHQFAGVCVYENYQIRVRVNGLLKKACEFALRAISRERKRQFLTQVGGLTAALLPNSLILVK